MSPLMRRRPLLRAMAIGGGAYWIGKRRGAERRESQGKPRLERLGELHEADSLTGEDFAQPRAQLLDS